MSQAHGSMPANSQTVKAPQEVSLRLAGGFVKTLLGSGEFEEKGAIGQEDDLQCLRRHERT